MYIIYRPEAIGSILQRLATDLLPYSWPALPEPTTKVLLPQFFLRTFLQLLQMPQAAASMAINPSLRHIWQVHRKPFTYPIPYTP